MSAPHPLALALIVEGDGEVSALPILVERIAKSLTPPIYIKYPPRTSLVHRVKRDKVAHEQDFKATLERLANQGNRRILVLLDADDDCPARLGPKLQAWAQEARHDVLCAVVLANREYETWFMYAAASLRGLQGEEKLALPDNLATPPNPEATRDAKKWISKAVDPNPRPTFSYKETTHQAAMTRAMDLEQARRSDSFDKLFREVCRLLGREAPPRREEVAESL